MLTYGLLGGFWRLVKSAVTRNHGATDMTKAQLTPRVTTEKRLSSGWLLRFGQRGEDFSHGTCLVGERRRGGLSQVGFLWGKRFLTQTDLPWVPCCEQIQVHLTVQRLTLQRHLGAPWCTFNARGQRERTLPVG